MNIGDRVMRIMLDGSIKHGIVVDKYESTHDHVNHFTNLYSVKWDDSIIIENGFMENGLKEDDKKRV